MRSSLSPNPSSQRPDLLGINTHFGGDKNAFVPQIVEVQKALATKEPRCAFMDTAKDTIANAAHFDTAGTTDVGNRFAEELIKVEVK